MSNFYDRQIEDLEDKNSMLEQDNKLLKKNLIESGNELLQQNIIINNNNEKISQLTIENIELKKKIESIKESNNKLKYYSSEIDKNFTEDIINAHYIKEFNYKRKRRFF